MSESFYLLSLGCPKNQVDAECMSAMLKAAGYVAVSDPSEATFLIVNTCGFIQDAKEEAIAAILDLADVSRCLRLCFLIVTGCLSQRYAAEIFEEMPEVDALLGSGEYECITDV